jgi:hypothetical protein
MRWYLVRYTAGPRYRNDVGKAPADYEHSVGTFYRYARSASEAAGMHTRPDITVYSVRQL